MSTCSNKLLKKGENWMGKAKKRLEMSEGRLCETGTYERVARERVACEKVVCEQVVCEKVCVCVFFFQHSFSKKSLVRAST
jgi:hypothetical protein